MVSAMGVLLVSGVCGASPAYTPVDIRDRLAGELDRRVVGLAGLHELRHVTIEFGERPRAFVLLKRLDDRRLLHDRDRSARGVKDLVGDAGRGLRGEPGDERRDVLRTAGFEVRVASTFSPRASRSGIVMRVIAPGEIVLTVQPYFASSSASTRVKPAMPAFAAP